MAFSYDDLFYENTRRLVGKVRFGIVGYQIEHLISSELTKKLWETIRD